MTDYSFFIHQAAMDPTRTTTLRAKWVADWNRRIKSLQRVVWKSVVVNDCLGLEEGERPTLQAQAALDPADPKQWAYRWSHEKVAEFMKWLQEMESRGLLEIVVRDTLRPGGEPWSNIYVRSAYQRGLQMSYDEMRKRSSGEIARRLGLTEADFPPTFRPTGGAISAIMQQPFHADRLALAYTRVFDELKGVTAEMDKQISQILTRGIAEGLNPRDIGELLADRIEKIGGTRGRLIARTETIHVHQQAALNEYYATEQSTGEVMLVEWKATMDARTRDTHAERNRRVYTKEEAYKLVGEPNCRCALLPFIPAVQGMPDKATGAARAAAERALGVGEVKKEKEAVERKSDVGTTKDQKSKPAVWDPPKKFSQDWYNERAKNWGFKEAYANRMNKDTFKELMNGIGPHLDNLLERFPTLNPIVFQNLELPNSKYDTTWKRRGLVLHNGENISSDLYSGRANGYYIDGSVHVAIKGERWNFPEPIKIPSPYQTTGEVMDGLATLRHEYGHFVHDMVSKAKKEEWIEIFKSEGGTMIEGRHRMSYKSPIAHNVSQYAASNEKEFFAECFTAYTDIEYGQHGRLPESVEKFFKELLG